MSNLSARYGNTALGEEKSFNRTGVWIKPKTEEGGGGTGVVCPFGRLVTIPGSPATQGILGGLIMCGDKNFDVANYELDVGTDGYFVLYITIPCEVNMDDDAELLLSGVKTSSAVSLGAGDWTQDAAYPDNTNPTVASAGIGTFIFPIGSITITGGVASGFSPTGCGSCTVNHCAGTLSHTRG